jgi:hypothetical protein
MTPTVAAIILIGMTLLALWGWRDSILQTRQSRAVLLDSIAQTLRQEEAKQVVCHDHQVTWEERGHAALITRVHEHYEDEADGPAASFTCSMPITNPISLKISRRVDTKSPVVPSIVGHGISTGHPGFDSKWKLTSSQPEDIKHILSPEKAGQLQAVLNLYKSVHQIEIRKGELCLHARNYRLDASADAARQLIQQTRAFRNGWEQAPDDRKH